MNPTYRGVLRLQLFFLGEKAETVPQRHLAPSKPFLDRKRTKGQHVLNFLSQLFSVNPGFHCSLPHFGVGRVGLPNPCPIHPWNPTLGMGRDRSQKTSKVVERYPQAWHLRQLFNWPTNRSRERQRGRRNSHCEALRGCLGFISYPLPTRPSPRNS